MLTLTTKIIFIASASLMMFLAFAPGPALADVKDELQGGVNTAAGGAQPDAEKRVSNIIRTIITLLGALVGIAAVIMIIFGGFRYVTSGGDPNKVASAKNTLLYALIGVIVAALAAVIVQFVLKKTTTG